MDVRKNPYRDNSAKQFAEQLMIWLFLGLGTVLILSSSTRLGRWLDTSYAHLAFFTLMSYTLGRLLYRPLAGLAPIRLVGGKIADMVNWMRITWVNRRYGVAIKHGRGIWISRGVIFTPVTYSGIATELHIETGVIIGECATISQDAVIGARALIGAHVRVSIMTNIEEDCQLGDGVRVDMSRIRHDAVIGDETYIQSALVGPGAEIGHHARLVSCEVSPQAQIPDHANITDK